MIGQTVSHYRILEKLGEGGMGVVYRAHDTTLDRDVALKFLPTAISGKPTDLQRFRQEAQTISALNHPNIATIHELGEHDGMQFIVFEYIERGTLKSRLSGGPLTIPEVMDSAIQIGEGLAHAHSHGIIHRDIKSENVMLTGESRLKITDFGLAKLQHTAGLTKTGATVGTAAYMSPEQARGDVVDHRTDIFSFGIVLYEMVTGQLPFKGEFEAALLYEIVNTNPRPVRELRPDAPDGLEGIIDRALEKDVTRRYQSVDAMLTDLRALQQGTEPGVRGHARHRLPFRPSRQALLITAGCIFLAVITLLVLPYFQKVPISEVPSIAILYLKNLGRAEDEPYTYGITQDVIIDVAKAGLVRVAPMKDILSIQETKLPTDQIAAKLRVKYVLDGTLKREGNNFCLSAQIIDAGTGVTLWADRLIASAVEASKLQGMLSRAIIAALHLKPSQDLAKDLASHRTANPEAYEYYLRGKYLFAKKKTQEDIRISRGMFQQAFSLDSLFVEARVSYGSTYEAMGDYLSADPIYTEALQYANGSHDIVQAANCLTRLGVAKWGCRDYHAAHEYDVKGLALYDSIGDQMGKSSILQNIGVLFDDQGETDSAFTYYEHALSILQTLGDKKEESRLLSNMGMAATDIGDYSDALAKLTRCLNLKKEIGDTRGEGIALLGLGTLNKDLGNYGPARNDLTQGLAIQAALGLQPFQVNTLKRLGQLFAEQGNYDSAETYFRRGLEMARSNGNESEAATIVMSAGKSQLDRSRYQAAIDSFIAAEKHFERPEDTEDLMLVVTWLSLAELGAGRISEARLNIGHADTLYEQRHDRPILMEVCWAFYQGYSTLGNSTKAWKYLQLAYTELDRRAHNIRDETLRQSYLTQVKDNREIATAWRSAGTKGK